MIEIIFQAILLIIIGIIYYKIIPYLHKQNIYDEVLIAVRAAQQMFESWDKDAKFKYVFNFIEDKFGLSEEEIKNMIESAVFEIKNSAPKN